MVIRVGVGLVAAVGLLAACGGAAAPAGRKMGPPPVGNTSCADVAARMAPETPTRPGELTALVEARCEADGWSEAARRCAVDAAPAPAIDVLVACLDHLTVAQRVALDDAKHAYFEALAAEREAARGSDEPDGWEGGEGECYDCGDPDGEVGGVVGGASSPPPPPPPPPPAPKVVAPTALEALRVSGEKNIVPDDATKMEIARSGKTKLMGVYKLCLAASGSIQSVSMIKSMGFTAYDTKIQTTMRTWVYRPFMLDGVATPVCTTVQFAYRQVDPDVDADAATP